MTRFVPERDRLDIKHRAPVQAPSSDGSRAAMTSWRWSSSRDGSISLSHPPPLGRDVGREGGGDAHREGGHGRGRWGAGRAGGGGAPRAGGTFGGRPREGGRGRRP